MKDPRLDAFIEFFNSQGVKFVDQDTGEEIKPTGEPNKRCPQCDSDIPISSTTCMWCKKKLEDK